MLCKFTFIYNLKYNLKTLLNNIFRSNKGRDNTNN